MNDDGWMPRTILRIAALLPVIIVLVATPMRIYGGHAGDFGLRPVALAAPFGIAMVAALAVLFFIRSERRAAILTAIGFLVLAASFMPGSDWTPFASDTEVRLSPGVAIAEIAIVAGLILAVRKFSRALLIAGAMTSAVLLIASPVMLVLAQDRAPQRPTPPKRVSGRPNIYHFIFDGFSTRAFTGALARRTTPALDGFILYANNRANYLATDASLPSLFTSSFFTGGPFRDFQARAREGGIRRVLQQHGYTVTTYTPDRNRFWWFAHADRAVTAQDLGRAKADPDGTRLLLQASLIRSSPAGLRFGMLLLTRQAMPWSAYNIYKQDLTLFDRFLSDEARRPARGQYVYFHIMLPHPPYRYDAACRNAARAEARYTSQAGCAALMMRRVVAHLRKQGRLDDAMIIFQGDHGFHSEESNLPPEHVAMPAAVRQKLDSMRDSFDADALIQRSHALLLMKPPGKPATALRISEAPTQLIDVAPTIAKAGGFSMIGAGMPVSDLAEGQSRAWHFFAGITRKHGLFRKRLGRDTETGRLAHVSLNGRRWRIHPDIVIAETSERPSR